MYNYDAHRKKIDNKLINFYEGKIKTLEREDVTDGREGRLQ